MREEHDQIIETDRPLTRRGFAMWGVAGLLAAGAGSLTLAQVSARELEPGDDRGGHGADDGQGDDHGRRRRRRRRRHS
jgi:hypothetical protein